MTTTLPAPQRSLRPAQLRVQHPDSDTAVVRADGDLDLIATPGFAELLTARLASTTHMIVIDLSRLSFLCGAALTVLTGAHQRARARGITVRLVTGPLCVTRAFRAGGLLDHFDTYPSRADALADRT